ncbi:hypothetical protein BSKO_09538 [Bryopsis sp. KO-2023]|nr:hypothetical protein BSKO_09538 [Bryopsis sp. KO-2023]
MACKHVFNVKAGILAPPRLVRSSHARRVPESTTRAANLQRVQRATRSIATAAAAGAVSKPVLEPGFSQYETILLLNPTLNDEARDKELARFEAFLNKEMATDISVSVRGRHKLAYPIQGYLDGVYVLYTYTAPRSVSQKVQKLLSNPEVGNEGYVIRHMTTNIA